MDVSRVSVVIPAYNRADLLAEALESVMAQDEPAFEVIVVDDGSTDGTAAVARSFAAAQCLAWSVNRGVAAARNAGIGAARGELIAFLDSDDTWPPHKLRTQAGFHRGNPEVACSVTRIETVLTPGLGRPSWVRPELLEGAHIGMATGSLMARREVFERVGPFDERLRVGEDSEWFFRARDAGIDVAVVPEVLLRRRIHGQNLSADAGAIGTNLIDSIRMSLGRRRAAVGVEGRSPS